jgi:hypothetical protein
MGVFVAKASSARRMATGTHFGVCVSVSNKRRKAARGSDLASRKLVAGNEAYGVIDGWNELRRLWPKSSCIKSFKTTSFA